MVSSSCRACQLHSSPRLQGASASRIRDRNSHHVGAALPHHA
jgi:hypothetical protein